MKGCLVKEYRYDSTDSGRPALIFGLVSSTLLLFIKDTHVLIYLTYYCWAQHVVMLPMKEPCPRLLCEIPMAAYCFWGLALGQLVSLEVSSGLNYNFLVCPCWKDWTVAASLCLASAWLEDRSVAKSYLVFGTGVNCSQWRWISPPKKYCWNGLLPPYPNNFSLPLPLLGGGLEERLNTLLKVGYKNLCLHIIPY